MESQGKPIKVERDNTRYLSLRNLVWIRLPSLLTFCHLSREMGFAKRELKKGWGGLQSLVPHLCICAFAVSLFIGYFNIFTYDLEWCCMAGGWETAGIKGIWLERDKFLSGAQSSSGASYSKTCPYLEISKASLDKSLNNLVWSHSWPCFQQ